MANAVRFRQSELPKQPGELARFKVVKGPDYGATYVLTGPKATIGRGEDSDVLISDLKASRSHADIFNTQKGWAIKDKGSANGIVHNGKNVREALLKISDVIMVGETVLEFVTPEVGTKLLTAPAKNFTQIIDTQKLFEDQKKKIREMGFGSIFGGGGTNTSLPGLGQGGPQTQGGSRRFLLYGVVGVGAYLFLFSGPDAQKRPAHSNTKSEGARDLASFLPQSESNKTADTLFKDGFREYLAGNYNRARAQFETVKQISPTHRLANIYIENCTKSIEDEVKLHLSNGKKSLEAGKLRQAKAHYERVVRLLYRDQSNSSYKEAKDQYDKVNKKISDEGTN